MRDDASFRLMLGVVVASLAVVRAYYQMQSRRAGPVKQFESSTNIALRSVAGLAGFAALIVCLVKPEWLAWASLPLWPALRWAGAPLGMASALMLVWVHHELGRNFSGTLHLRAEHTLVTSGPYRWIRHPMYTALYVVRSRFFCFQPTGSSVPSSWAV